MSLRNILGLVAMAMFGLVIFTMVAWHKNLGETWIGLAGASVVGAAALFSYFFMKEKVR